MQAEINRSCRFGPFRIDAENRQLFRDGTVVPLTPKVFDALTLLVANAGRLVTKDALMQALWPNTFVTEANLTQTVFVLRKALGESATEQRHIVTVPGRGYRFEGTLEPEPPPEPPTIVQPHRSLRRWAWVATAVVVVFAAAVLFRGWQSRRAASHTQELRAPDPRAVQLYEKGRLFWNKRNATGFAEALRYFNQATAVDPGYAPPYAGIADTYALMSGYNLVSQDEYMPKARAAAQKALELDGRLAEAHASLALIAQDYDWDWKTAEDEYRRAIELDPKYPTAHHWYAECLAFQGKFKEALAEIDRARQLDPASLIIQADRGVFLYFSGQYEAAEAQLKAVLQLDPYFPRAFMLTQVYNQLGRYEEAQKYVESWRRVGVEAWAMAITADTLAREGRASEAQRSAARLEDWYQAARQDRDPMPLVHAFARLDKDKAFKYLDLALQRHSGSLTALKVDPSYEPLRNDPRLPPYLSRLGFSN